jgi:hypothetical protein
MADMERRQDNASAKTELPRSDRLPVMFSLKEVVDRYASLAKSFGEPVALSAFELSPQETSRVFSDLDEDYHISRYLHFSNGAGQSYLVGGEAVTHVAIDRAISTQL